MPSLLEALERKYFNDCFLENWKDDNEKNSTANGGGSNNNSNSDDDDQRLISIFIPRLPPLLSVPELLVLNDCDIDCAGNFETIKDKCCRVRELDLAQNKLNDWEEVFHILRHLPRIEFLNLSKNQLMGPITQFYAPCISNLRGIVLNGTYLDWDGVNVLLQNLPILEELHLSLNNYKEVLIDADDVENGHNLQQNAENQDECNQPSFCCSEPMSNEDMPFVQYSKQHRQRYKKISAHNALKTLHFTGNPVENWPEISRLGRVFPKLENLVLAECPIKTIHVGSNEENSTEEYSPSGPPYKYFPNLMLLNLSCANINTWDDIDQLAMFPKLCNLRVKNWPLWERVECTEHERRQLLIARLPNVNLLNGGGVISAVEREDAERAFIRYYMDKPNLERPKRYDELIAKHGKLDPLVDVNLKPDKNVKIFLTLQDKTEERMVNVYRTVSDLKTKLEKIYNLPANKMRLFYLDKDYKEFGPEIMKYPNKMLYSYNIQPGDEIIIDEKK